MKKSLYPFVVVALALGVSAGIAASPVAAAPVASFTASTPTPHVGDQVTFDASASVCDTAVCSYQFTLSWTGTNHATHTITTLYGPVASYTFAPVDATYPYGVTMLVKVTNSTRTHAYGTAQQSFVVAPAPPPVPPPLT